MNKHDWIEEEVAKRPELPAHNRSTLRSMLAREWDDEEASAARVDNQTGNDDQ